MNGQSLCCTERTSCQHVSAPPPAPARLLARLPFLLDRLRALEQRLFSLDSCDPAGLAAGQCKVLLLRYQIGVPVRDDELREARLALEYSVELEP